MWTLALVSAAASIPACAALQKLVPPAALKSPVRVELENVDDMMFTASVAASGQIVHPIMDTGSFELVLFEHDCSGCSDRLYFNRRKARKDFEDMKVEATQGYGSGTAHSTAVRAGVSLDPLQAKQQMFWLAHEVDMRVYLDDSFAGIFGLGPPASALSFARAELATVEEQVKELAVDVEDVYEDLLVSMRQVVKLAEAEKPWLEDVGVNIFSICLMPGLGKDGVLVLNDEIPESDRWVAVHGDYYWQVHVGSASIGEAHAKRCTAIVDSGTSLIGAPAAFLKVVEALVDDLGDRYGCQDLSQWPNFELKLSGGQVLVLAPSSYLANFDEGFQLEKQKDRSAQAAIEQAKELMPHIERASQRQRASGASTVCAPAMFSMDEGLGGSGDCQFLLGLPVFREYYISHELEEDGNPKAMLFSKSDGDCTLLANQTEMHASRTPVVPLRVDMKKIRFPSLALNRTRGLSLKGRHAGSK